MSYTITDENDVQDQVASTAEWSELCEWSETLNPDKYEGICHLCLHGWDRDLDQLAEQIATALEEASPPKNVASVLKGIHQYLEKDMNREVVIITNGTEPSDEDDDDEDVEESKAE